MLGCEGTGLTSNAVPVDVLLWHKVVVCQQLITALKRCQSARINR
jgi:hypothetical protein